MELDWSEQSAHIRSLYRPWEPGDGYDEETLQAAEARLGVRLPLMLQQFFLGWGQRVDMTRRMHPLLPPDQLKIKDGALLFWAENQAVVLWGVLREVLDEADPSVVVAWNVEEGLQWTPSHARLSDFFDDLTYFHALVGGAIHGGRSAEVVQEPQQIRWLENQWSKARVGPACFGWPPDTTIYPTLYTRAGQALYWEDSRWRAEVRSEETLSGIVQTLFWDTSRWHAATNSEEALDEIAQELQIPWAVRW
jgi:hypothetical protein